MALSHISETDPGRHAPQRPERPSRLETTDLSRFFGPDGPLAAGMADYELRPSQLQMAEAVKQALLARRTALIEAPTGTGKSIAYLLPAFLSGKTVVVATANKSLQNQLYTKDIPFLSQVLGQEIDAVLVKGRSNYICNHKWDKEAWEQQRIALYDREHEQITFLRQWLEETDTGDVDDLPFELDGDLRRRLVSFPDDCLHRDCRHYMDNCWVNFMRDRAASAQVLITNHHLLLTVLQLGEAGERLLPSAGVYVIDEAHQLEGIATAVFEVEITDYTLEQLLNRGVFKEYADADRLDELRFHNTIAFQEAAHLGDGSAFRIETELEELKKLASNLQRLLEEMRRQNPYKQENNGERQDSDEAAEARANYELALEALGSTVRKFDAVATSRRDGEVVRYAERVHDQRMVSLRLHAAPINPANLLAEYLFGLEQATVVCTSATLATNKHFEHFKTRCGVIHDESRPPVELVAPPVFDYPSQALLYQPALPAYNWQAKDAYYDAVAQEIRRLLEVSRGRALCLFTNWSGLKQVQERLAADPAEQAAASIWPIRAQGDASRNALLDWFRQTPYSVLFATRSFWEGVDLPGDDLSLVVLDKMPFPTPSDPLHSARMQAIDQAGEGRSFAEYMLPLMTLSLKQGFGRLIRRAKDRGVVAILDERLTSKGYGRQARQDLPPTRFSRNFGEVHTFFREALASQADFALNVCSALDSGSPPRVVWQWQLLRMQDGKADNATGSLDGNDPVQGEIHAALQGLRNLGRRIEQAGRRPGQFGVELRCSTPTAAFLKVATGDGALWQAWVQEQAQWKEIQLLGVRETVPTD